MLLNSRAPSGGFAGMVNGMGPRCWRSGKPAVAAHQRCLPSASFRPQSSPHPLLTFPNPCYIIRLEVYMVNSPSRLNLRPVDPPAPGGWVRQPIHLPAPVTRPARGVDGPVTASPARNLRAETRFSRQIQPNPDKSRYFQISNSRCTACPPRQRTIADRRKWVPVLQTGNALGWHTQACARGFA